MKIDIARRVENLHLPLTLTCVPLFESPVVEAIDESGQVGGHIKVLLCRDQAQGELADADESLLAPMPFAPS